VRGTLVFAPPKRGKLRDVPLDPEVSAALRAHMDRFLPVEVTLPWLTPTGPKVTHRLVFTSGIGAAIWSQGFNDQAWKPALASAGSIPVPEQGKRYAAARGHGMHALRHFCVRAALGVRSMPAPDAIVGWSGGRPAVQLCAAVRAR
jgi:integrase